MEFRRPSVFPARSGPRIGKPPEAIGKPPEAIGKPPEAIGKPPEAIGKPPEAIGRRRQAGPAPVGRRGGDRMRRVVVSRSLRSRPVLYVLLTPSREACRGQPESRPCVH
ncbi:hypothetical protein FOHLNKBM_1433 [Methylobacterium longum]|nr:hypothetical protein FOHLNKBM_1433 [Methylobacterium longum]